MSDWTSIHNRAKWQASKIADHAEATAGGPYIAANMIMARRNTKGAHAALLAGLVVGTLCGRGRDVCAERLTKELAMMAGERE